MALQEPDWESIHKWLQPKGSEYWVEEPSLTQKVFLKTTAQEVLFGGAAGGGKSSALLMAALQYVDIPSYSAILFRRTYADLALPGALMDRFRDWISNYEDIHWNANQYTATFPSGARITFGYLNNSQDYLRYKGSEFQFIGMDEVTEIREADYRYLFSRLRRPSTGPLSQVPLRMRAATNPAPNWVRQRFLVEGNEKGRIFVPSKLTDNPGIDPDSYRAVLAELDPVERKRLEFGDWWATTLGSMFDRTQFEILEPAEIPDFNKETTIVRFWDLAGTEPSPSYPDPDWTVGCLGAMHGGIFYVLDVRRIRAKGDRVEKFIKETAEEDGAEISIMMEQEPGSAGKNLIDQYARYVLVGYDFKGQRSTGDKETRAKPMSAAVANGNVRLLRGIGIPTTLMKCQLFRKLTYTMTKLMLLCMLLIYAQD
jgi:predicted phage terminase large subunit-like protein